MSVKNDKQVVSVVLSKDIILKLDTIASLDDRSRGYIIKKIIEENIDKYIKEGN